MALSADVRRVVTTIDVKDKAVVLFDGPNPHKKVRPHAQTAARLVWVTDQTPADLSGTKDRAAVDLGIMPPRGGSVFRVVQFSPDKDYMGKWDADAAFASVGHHTNDAGNHASDAAAGKSGRPKGMHQTDTVDYAIVMSGEIWLVMDEGEVLLKSGDILVQRATNHGWSNRGDVPMEELEDTVREMNRAVDEEVSPAGFIPNAARPPMRS